MDESNFKIQHTFAEGSPAEITVRHGEAPTIYDPEQIRLSGIISAPVEYYQKRPDACKPTHTHVVFDKKGKKVTLTVDDTNKFKTIVTGSLEKHAFLKTLHINSQQSYGISDLLKTLRFAKRFFAEPGKHTEFILKLRNFTAKITQTTSQTDDRQGNKKQSFESKVEEFQKEALSFILNIPVFEGTDPLNIKIDIEIEAINGTVQLFLICDDLEEMEDEIVSSLFSSQKKVFASLVCIDQS